MSLWAKHILPHGDFKQLVPGVWQVTGILPKGHLPRNMVFAKLPSGGLILHSVIALEEHAIKYLESYGLPEVMIVPSPRHRLDTAVYFERYPNIKVLCPEAIMDKIRETVPVTISCEAKLEEYGIRWHRIPGVKPVELAYEFGSDHRQKAMVFCDTLMHLPHLPGFDGLMMRLMGSTGFFGITRIGRFFLMEEKAALAEWLRQQSERADIGAISVAHGSAIIGEAPTKFAAAAGRLS